MSNAPRLAIDVTKISGPYPLLALFLVIVEALLLFWMARAEDSLERIVAGSLMALIFAGFLYVFIRTRPDMESQSVEAPGLPPVAPAEEDVSKTEVESPHADEMAGRDYVIAKPPDDWTVIQQSAFEAIAGALQISDEAAKEALLGGAGQEGEVLTLSSPRVTTVEQVPGQTLIDGQKVPTALAVDIPVRLQVWQLDRAQPPFYIERTLEHNFALFLGAQLRSGVVTLRGEPQSSQTGSGRRRITAVCSQEVANARINGVSGASVALYVVMIAIEGDVRDHLIVMNYPSMAGESELTEDATTLQRLVDSFRSLRVINAASERKLLRQQWDKKLEEFKSSKGRDLFIAEFRLLMSQLKGVDMSNPASRLRAISLLQPFELLGHELGLEDEDLPPLWAAMHQAETGDATVFIKEVDEFINAFVPKEEPESGDDSEASTEDGRATTEDDTEDGRS